MHTALLSASDKMGLADFARDLRGLGWNLLGLRGTAEYLNEQGIPTRDISKLAVHPLELIRLGVPRIDLVYVDLFPLGKEVTSHGCTLASVTEKVDGEGVAMLLYAAKSRRFVLHSQAQFPVVLKYIRYRWQSLPLPDWNDSEHEKFVSSLIWQATAVTIQHLRVFGDYNYEQSEGRGYRAQKG